MAPFLLILIVGFVIGLSLTTVAAVKTIRYHGFGQQRWAPPAVPWFCAGLVVLVLAVILAFTVGS